MLRNLTAKQFREWLWYSELEPFDETRDDYRIASIVQVIANVNRGKHQRAYKLEDFMLAFGDRAEAEKPKQTFQEQVGILEFTYALLTAEAEAKKKAA